MPSDLGKLVEAIFQWALALVGAAIFVNFLWAGFLWFTSAGRPGPISQAKEKMTNAIIGAIILLASVLILKTINPDLIRNTFTLPGIQAPAIQPGQSSGGSGSGTGINQTCITIPSNYTYTPPSSCELPFKSGVLRGDERAIFGECRGVLWTIRNTNSALACSQNQGFNFVFRGIPASIWEGWKNNEAQRVVNACSDVCNPDPGTPDSCDQGRFPASVDKNRIIAALEPYWNLCIDSKGISCVCTPNDSTCRRPINLTALIQKQCPLTSSQNSSRDLPNSIDNSVSSAAKRESNASAYGYLDGISSDGNFIEGWAYNPVTPNQSNYVILFIDDGQEGKFIKVPTLIQRPDVNTARKITGTHGFIFPINYLDENFKDGRDYNLSAYVEFGDNRLLNGSPITLSADIIRNAREPDDSKYDSLISQIPYEDDLKNSLKKLEEAGLIVNTYSKRGENDRTYYEVQSPESNQVLLTIGVHAIIKANPANQALLYSAMLCKDGSASVLFFKNRTYNVKKKDNTVRIRELYNNNENTTGLPEIDEGIKKALDYLDKLAFPLSDSRNRDVPRFRIDESAEKEDITFMLLPSYIFSYNYGNSDIIMLVEHFEWTDSRGLKQEHTHIMMNASNLTNKTSAEIMRIVNHEMGHVLGLGHEEYDPNSLMHNYIRPNNNSSYSADHINAVRNIYNPQSTRELSECRDPITGMIGLQSGRPGQSNATRGQEGFNPYSWYDFLWKTIPGGGGGGGQTGSVTVTCWIIPGVLKCPAF